jgi:glyoxylate reductase
MSLDVDKTLLSNASNLKVIGNYGVGYDNIDIKSAQSLGIAVSNTPHSTTNPTANHTFALILSMLRKVAEHDCHLKSGKLERWYGRKILGTSIEGKTLGIVGMGRIGKAVAARAVTFGMKVIYHQRTPLSIHEEKMYNTSYKSLEDLCSTADIITIHTPLTDTTKDLISTEEIELMKPNVYLVNTARGGIINEASLIIALSNNRIAGAALDVFENEPHPRPEFFSLKNVVLTPHTGTGTHEARDAMLVEAMENIVSFLTQGDMPSRVV